MIEKINNHQMYWEEHGEGEPVFLSGGWGSFCHGGERHLPAGLTERYRVIIYDHRGLGQSDDREDVPSTTELLADDVIGLADHLGIERAHFVGIVGIGACIFQQVALRQPDLVRSLINSGAWAKVDATLATQLELWLEIHEKAGFNAFQKAVVLASFRPDYVAARMHRLLGPNGGWRELRDNISAHRRFTEAALTHDTLARLPEIKAPSLVFHNGMDQITAPCFTRAIQRGIPGAEGIELPQAAHVVTGRDAKASFDRQILEFLERH